VAVGELKLVPGQGAGDPTLYQAGLVFGKSTMRVEGERRVSIIRKTLRKGLSLRETEKRVGHPKRKNANPRRHREEF